MKIFISWSGETSKAVAEVLREWLPNVIQAADPWMSSEDIGKGSRWSHEISEKLEKTHAGIICVTPENQASAWLNYEAGALAKTVSGALVCPYLWGLRPAELRGPLAQFQAVDSSNQADTLKMLKAFNVALAEKALLEKHLERTFGMWWGQLESGLVGIKPSQDAPPVRDNREILEEILDLVRQVNRSMGAGVLSPGTVFVPTDRHYGLATPASRRLSDLLEPYVGWSSALQAARTAGADPNSANPDGIVSKDGPAPEKSE